MGFRFLCSTEITFGKPNPHVSGGQISIQCQRALTFGDALSGTFGKDLDHAKETMRQSVVWRERKYLGQRRFGCHEACGPVASQHGSSPHGIDECRADDCFNVVRIQAQGLFEKPAR
jgi:hypothetical protein